METEKKLKTKIRRWIALFVVLLILSGITAFPLEWELGLLHKMNFSGETTNWIEKIYEAIKITNSNYPFLFYGTDWLAFSHLVIAVAFLGPYREPVKNIWVIEFGIIACLMIFPLAFIAGHVRGIPVYWELIDCSFGAIGILPLLLIHKYILQLKKLNPSNIPDHLRIIK